MSLREIFKEINILTVASQYILANIMYVHQNSNQFKKRCDFHNINTRNKNKIATPALRLHKVQNSFLGLSVRFYNKIPEDIINLPINKFKNHIKKTLMRKGYYTIKDYLTDKNAWN